MHNIKLNEQAGVQPQQGFILLTALAFMIVLTVIVISTVNVSTSDEKIARNSRDKDIAFAAAAAALRDAELYISGSYNFPYTPNCNAAVYTSPPCTLGKCDLRATAAIATPIDQLDFFSGTDTRDGSIAITNATQCPSGITDITTGAILKGTVGPMKLGCVTGSPQINGVNAPPRYLIEIVNLPQGIPPPVCSGLPTNYQFPFAFRITAQAEGRSATTRVTLQEVYTP